MSISVDSIPFSPSFLGGKPEFRLQCSSAVGGAVARFGVLVRSSFPSGKSLVISYANRSIHFTKADFVLEPGTSWDSLSALRDAIANNFYLADDFTVETPSSSDTSASFYLVARAVGATGLTLSSDAPSGVSFTGADGTDPTILPNYAAVCRFETSRGNTAWFRLHPVDGIASVQASMVGSLLGAPSLPPVVGSFQPMPVSDIISARLRYAESYGSVPQVQRLFATDYVSFFPGTLIAPYDAGSLPDWFDMNPSIPLSHPTQFVARVIGEDSGLQLPLFRNQKQFIHIYALNTASDAPASYRIHIDVTFFYADGTEAPNRYSFLLNNGALYRLDVSPELLAVPSDVVAYSVNILNPNDTAAFSRRYILRPALPHIHHFLLTNRYGLIESFALQGVNRAASFDGEQMSIDGSFLFDISNRSETFTAMSTLLSHSQAQRLAQSLSGKYSYYLVAGRYQRIAIHPDSFNYYAEDQNLVRLAFDFTFVANQPANIPSINTSPFSPALIDGALLTADGYLLLTEADDTIMLD